MGVIIRPADSSDASRIAAFDHEVYGHIQESQTDDARSMFEARIRNCHGWFLIAEEDGDIVALIAAQKTIKRPEYFLSWEDCTADGTFEGTHDPDSDVAYVASLTANRRGSELDAPDLLIGRLMRLGLKAGIKRAFFCGRMPGFHLYASEMTPQQYYNARVHVQSKSLALDPQIRMYESLGMTRDRLVAGGFAADAESHGYAVLYTFAVPFAGWPLKSLWAWLIEQVAQRPWLLKLIA